MKIVKMCILCGKLEVVCDYELWELLRLIIIVIMVNYKYF